MDDETRDRLAMPPPKRPCLDPRQSNIQSENTDLFEDVEDTDKTTDADKYSDFVTPEEMEKLREFKVLDEVKSNDEDSNDEDSDSSDGTPEAPELPEDEIEKMLEEDLPEGYKGAPKPKEKTYITRQKIVLDEKGVNQFEVLPLDWMLVRHHSGMPIYMHRGTRVCTLAKPYFLGNGNTRRHEIPISAIPCFAYRRALQEEEKQREIDEEIAEKIRTGSWGKNARILSNNILRSRNNNTTVNTVNHTEPREPTVAVNAQEQQSLNVNNSNSVSSNVNSNVNDSTNCEVKTEEIQRNISQCPFSHNEQFTTNDPVDNSNSEDSQEHQKEIKQEQIDTELTILDTEALILKSDIESQSQEEMDNTVKEENVIEVQPNVEAQANNEEVPLNRQPVVLPGEIVMAPPRVETVNTSWKTQPLTPEQVNEYCSRLFKFKTLKIMHFERWADRRKYAKARKALQHPALPEGTKLITIPAGAQENGGKPKRDWVMNINGRSYLSVFHEYARRALQMQPEYEFKHLENASMPYQATVVIGDMQYGCGRGASKRQAKAAAARAAIAVLVPELRAPDPAPRAAPDFTFFDSVGVLDPRVPELCAAACEPSPHAVLSTCLLRHAGAAPARAVACDMKKLEFQKIELTMKVGKHSATVVCKNKKEAKQRASQAILQALHPHVRSWGSLLRLYGSHSVKSCKEKKLEEQQITLLQDKARHNEPNYAVLEKLRQEMRRLKERDAAVVPIGTLLVPEQLPTHSASNLDSVDL